MRTFSKILVAIAAGWTMSAAIGPSPAAAQGAYVVTPVAEKKLKSLPAGLLYWRIETFPSAPQAEAAAAKEGWNPNSVSFETMPSLVVDVAGKTWLLTLGPKGGSTTGGTFVAEVGPVPSINAPEYLLRINKGHGPSGARTPTHTHPGSEAFYVIQGQLGQKTPSGVSTVDANKTMNGHPAGLPMEVFNSGASDLTALIMFVVDASKPFSTPAKFD